MHVDGVFSGIDSLRSVGRFLQEFGQQLRLVVVDIHISNDGFDKIQRLSG